MVVRSCGRGTGEDARDEHGHEHHDEGRVEQVGVEQAYLDADRHRCERRRRLCQREAEEKSNLGPREPEHAPREVRGSGLANEDDGERESGNGEDPALRELLRVDQHSRREEKERDEQHAADELDLLHEAASSGDETVERQPGEEGPDDPLDPRPIGDQSCRGERRENEQEPGPAVLSHAGEHPTGNAGEEEGAEDDEDDEPENDLEQENSRPGVALDGPGDDGEHRERERVRHHRPAPGDTDGSLAQEPVLLDNRIGDERVRSP